MALQEKSGTPESFPDRGNSTGAPLLKVEDLSVAYTPRDHDRVPAVNNVTFTIAENEFVGLLGESGCGKSTLGNAILRLLNPPARITGGRVLFDGVDVASLSEDKLREIRWVKLATVFQSSMNSLNPVIRIREQFDDTFRAHGIKADRAQSVELLRMVSLEPSVLDRYAHELSGGMRQRVALAMALALRPKLVVLDEPTTGLDVVVQHDILTELRRLRTELGFAVLFISHDLGTVLDMADRALVMYGGELVENRTAQELLRDPRHPYSRALLASYADPRAPEPRVSYLPGRPPDLTVAHQGCLFAPRCPYVEEQCREIHPDLTGNVRCLVDQQGRLPERSDGVFPLLAVRTPGSIDAEPILRVDDVTKIYSTRRGFKASHSTAVDNVSLDLRRGRVTALVGQSGSGKSTIAKLITAVEKPSSGAITFKGEAVGRKLREYRRHVQMVFQDPFSALNPTRTISYALARPLSNYRGLSGSKARDAAAELLESVGLSPASQYLDKLPHQLSGGQRQRVVIARALAPEPEVLIADEPVSMLDVSIRAEILQLLAALVTDRRLAMLYITHDLLSARLLADDVLVLNRGQLVESGPTAQVIANPQDDYTKLLLDSIPKPFGDTQAVERGATA